MGGVSFHVWLISEFNYIIIGTDLLFYDLIIYNYNLEIIFFEIFILLLFILKCQFDLNQASTDLLSEIFPFER